MSESSPVATPTEVNPFQSPEVLEAEGDGTNFPNTPSARVLWTGLGIGSVLNLVTSYTFYANEGMDTLAKVSWVIPDLGHGVMYGLGLALLAHALMHRRFSTLMPGHWRLIASASALPGFFLAMPWTMQPDFASSGSVIFVPELLQQAIGQALALVFYGFVIVWAQESGIWKTYAWLAAASYLLSFLQFASFGLISDGMWSDPTTGFGTLSLVLLAVNLMSGLVSLAAFVMLIIGVVVDYQKKIPRDIYHYLGVVLVLVLPVVQWIWSVGLMAFGGISGIQPFSF